jgi:hypothetical protein
VNEWMAKENVVFISNEVLFSHEEEWDCALCKNIDETGEHDVKWNEPVSQRQVLHIFCLMWNLGGKNTTWK